VLRSRTKTLLLSEAGRAAVERLYTWTVMTKQFETLMENIVSQHLSTRRKGLNADCC
jgi:hypothetical protein